MRLSEGMYGTINVDGIPFLQCDTFSSSNNNNNIKIGPFEGWGKIGKNFRISRKYFLTLNTMLLPRIFTVIIQMLRSYKWPLSGLKYFQKL